MQAKIVLAIGVTVAVGLARTVVKNNVKCAGSLIQAEFRWKSMACEYSSFYINGTYVDATNVDKYTIE